MTATSRWTIGLSLRIAVIVCTMATSCWRQSRIALAPTPSISPAIMRSDALLLVDSIARDLKLKWETWEGSCEMESPHHGTLAGFWRGGSVDVSVCVDPDRPEYFRIDIRDCGFVFRDNSRSLRENLANALRSRFGPDVVTVETK